jgi:hypothetical protein
LIVIKPQVISLNKREKKGMQIETLDWSVEVLPTAYQAQRADCHMEKLLAPENVEKKNIMTVNKQQLIEIGMIACTPPWNIQEKQNVLISSGRQNKIVSFSFPEKDE